MKKPAAPKVQCGGCNRWKPRRVLKACLVLGKQALLCKDCRVK